MAELPALKLERARFMVEITTDADEATAEGIDVDRIPCTDQSWDAAGTDHEGGLRWRAFAFSAGAEGGACRSGFSTDFGFRRNRHWCWWRSGGCNRPAAAGDFSSVCRCSPSPMRQQVAARAGDASADFQRPGRRRFEKISTRVATMAPGDRTEEIARMLAGASVTEEARAAAKRLLAGNG